MEKIENRNTAFEHHNINNYDEIAKLPMTYDLWPMTYDLWPMTYDLWPMTYATCCSLATISVWEQAVIAICVQSTSL